MNKRKIFPFLCFVLIASWSLPQPAHAAWWDILFPPVKKGPDPSETLRAPFADEDAVIEDLDSSGQAYNSTPLEKKHRTDDIIIRWIQTAVPTVLSYKGESYERDYKGKVAFFTDVGAKEYLKFMQERNFIKTLKTGGYDISGFVQDFPIILNEGPVKGRYRWLFQMNIMVTYIEAGVTSYKENAESLTQEFELTMQVGRHRNVDNEHGLLIETWSIKTK